MGNIKVEQRLERWLSHPLSGLLVLFVIVAAIFLFIGKFVAQQIVGITQGILMEKWYFNLVMGYGLLFWDPDSFIGNLFLGEYGLFTMVPIYLFGLLLPLVFSFYLVLHCLQDSGIFSHLSKMADGSLRRIGLSGSAMIPMILGFGCVTAALISTASLPSKRERFIASVLLCIVVPCSAQLAILMAVASTLGARYLLLYFAVVTLVFLAIGFLLNFILKGSPSPFVARFAPIRFPRMRTILKKAVVESKAFLLDATPTFALGSVLMALLQYFNGFSTLYEWFSPITRGLLHLPDQATNLFVLSVVKKDLGAAMLYSIVHNQGMTDGQITVALVVTTLFVPCFAATLVLYKDRGPIVASIIWLSSLSIAILMGAAVSMFLTLNYPLFHTRMGVTSFL